LACKGEKPKNIKIAYPPDSKLGDFSFECFSLSKSMKKSPSEIAGAIAEKIESDGIIEKVSAQGPYVNIFLTNCALFSVLEQVLKRQEEFGSLELGKGEKILIEYLAPNTNKPLHLGHARNGSLGTALAKILKKSGHEVIKANLINDRGIHICKSMLAYEKWGENSTPESLKMKSDHFVGHWYVKYNQELSKNPELENEALEMLQKWEEGDKKTLELWKKMNDWVYAGWEKTYESLKLDFDIIDYESQNYQKGKNIIDKGLKKGIFEKDSNGSITFALPVEEFGLDQKNKQKKVTLVRPNGTSLYMTQDIGTAVSRFENNKLTRMIYVVGSEQIHHFKCLFKILESLDFDWAGKLYHLHYGMITLPEGKMKSREGKVVDTDDLIEEIKKLAEEEVKKRVAMEKISVEEIKERSEKIALGAIKFYFLRVGAGQDIEFNPKESVSFDGFTGPYCQYAYARISSIFKKTKNEESKNEEVNLELLGNNLEERDLMKKIMEFPEKIKRASLDYNPNIIAVHTFEISQLFNKFYQKHPVLNAENEELKNARLALIQAVQIVIKSGLNLLGIETLEKM
jgi:arginyl-tRNA synthetase